MIIAERNDSPQPANENKMHCRLWMVARSGANTFPTILIVATINIDIILIIVIAFRMANPDPDPDLENRIRNAGHKGFAMQIRIRIKMANLAFQILLFTGSSFGDPGS